MAAASYLNLCRFQLQQVAPLSRIGGLNTVPLSKASHGGWCSCRSLCQSTNTPDHGKSKSKTISNNETSKTENTEEVKRGLKSTELKKAETEYDTNGKSFQNQASEYFRRTWLSHYSASVEEKKKLPPKHFETQTVTGKNVRRLVLKDSQSQSSNINQDENMSRSPDLRNPNERIDEEIPEDVDERRDPRLSIPLSRYGRMGRKSFYYTRKISILGREGKIREAIAVFEHWMMVRDRVMPTKRTFVALIGILGRVGYTDKAFELYGKMKQLGLDPEDHIYTSLFNACANSPSPENGLRRADNLFYQMKDVGIRPNLFTVKAAMKAMAVCGDFPRAFAIMDEASTYLQIDAECFDHLLMACISDKEAGFRRALQVWQKMGEYGIQPATNTFNLLVRTARDCGIGEPDTFSVALGLPADSEISPSLGLLGSSDKTPRTKYISSGVTENKKVGADKSKNPEKSSKSVHSVAQVKDTVLPCDENDHSARVSDVPQEISSVQDNVNENLSFHDTQHQFGKENDIFNKLDKDLAAVLSCRDPSLAEDGAKIYEWWEDEPPTEDHIESQGTDLIDFQSSQIAHVESSKLITLTELKLPHGRLALLGGPKKLLSLMEEFGLQPEIRTYAQILACLPVDESSELQLLTLMEESKVKPDIDFLNDVMMRRNKRGRHDTVRAILPVISRLRLTPNMRTYAALAMACRKEKQAHDLLQDMKEANVEPNAVIMGHLICASGVNFTYKRHMLETMETLGLKPDRANIEVIEKTIAYTKKKVIEAEKRKDTSSFYLSEPYQNSFGNFLRFYYGWLKRTEVSQRRHPWDAFKPVEPQKQEASKRIV